jgi:hypothetical protein
VHSLVISQEEGYSFTHRELESSGFLSSFAPCIQDPGPCYPMISLCLALQIKPMSRLKRFGWLGGINRDTAVVFAASHMETRVVALLKRTDRVGNPNAPRVRPGRKARRTASIGTGSVADKKPQRKAKRKVDRECIDEEEELHQVCTMIVLSCAVALCGPVAPASSCALLRCVWVRMQTMFA